MPKLLCQCGENIDLSPIPNQQGFKLIWEPLIEPFIDDLVQEHQQITSKEEFEKQAYKLFYERQPAFPQVYECPFCGRLLIFAHASDETPALWFQREEMRENRFDSLRSLVQQGERQTEKHIHK